MIPDIQFRWVPARVVAHAGGKLTVKVSNNREEDPENTVIEHVSTHSLTPTKLLAMQGNVVIRQLDAAQIAQVVSIKEFEVK